MLVVQKRNIANLLYYLYYVNTNLCLYDYREENINNLALSQNFWYLEIGAMKPVRLFSIIGIFGRLGFEVDFLTILTDDDSGRADDGTVVGNINHVQKAIGADADVVSDSQWSQNRSSGPDENIIADGRMPLADMLTGPP